MDYDRGLAAQAQRLTPFRPWNETTQLLLPVEADINESHPFGRGVVVIYVPFSIQHNQS